MKWMIGAMAFGMLLVPVVTAAPNVQTGSQSGSYWSEGTRVAVQPGTGFTLQGVVGDHDVFFYDASDTLLSVSAACGSDGGTVPANAKYGIVRVWDHTGEILPCNSLPGPVPLPFPGLPVAPPVSNWVYVDGLPVDGSPLSGL